MSANNDDRDSMRKWELAQDELVAFNSVASSAGSTATMAVLVQSATGHLNVTDPAVLLAIRQTRKKTVRIEVFAAQAQLPQKDHSSENTDNAFVDCTPAQTETRQPAHPLFFSCVCLMASMARSVNCLGQKKAVQVHLIGAKPIVQVKT